MAETKPQVVTIPATMAHRKFGELIRRVVKGKERFIVEKDGLPVAAIVSIEEYQMMERERQRIEKNLRDFEEFSREIGKQFEKDGVTEEQLIAEMKQIRREIFREKYGDLKKP